MSHMPVGLDLEDLTPRQLRKALSHYARMSVPSKKKKDDNEGDDEDDKENDDLVDLHREKTGDSKPPKVTKDDLPKGFSLGDDDEDEKPSSKKGGS
jgi:hypothetical protein